MRRRSRVFAGILALMALTLSLAESVWASTCAPAMTATSSPVADPAADPDCAHGAAGGSESEDSQTPRCPLGQAAAAQGCLTTASHPSVAAETPIVGPAGEAGHFPEPARQGQLAGRSLFHPPRA